MVPDCVTVRVQDAVFAERYWRRPHKKHEEAMKNHGQRGRDAVLRLVERFVDESPELAVKLVDREVGQRHLHRNEDTKLLLSLTSLSSQWRWLKKVFQAIFNCIGRISLYWSNGYWWGANSFGVSFGFSASMGKETFMDLVKGNLKDMQDDNNLFLSASFGFAAGLAQKYVAVGVGVSGSLSLGCGDNFWLTISVSGLGVAIIPNKLKAQCLVGWTIPAAGPCVKLGIGGIPECTEGCYFPPCAGCMQSAGVSLSVFCCDWNPLTNEHSCR